MIERINPYEDWHPIEEAAKRMKETNSCTVVALTCVTGYNFEECHRHMKIYGNRLNRRGMLRDDQLAAFLALGQHFKIIKSPYTKSNRITINQFIKKHPKGKFYCASRGHAFAIIDGVLYDHSDKPRRQITFAHRFYNKEDLEELYNERKQTK